MKRISTQMPNTDMQFYMREREYRMNSVQNKMAGQTRILNLRDDPTAAAHAIRYQSGIHRLEQFSKNVEYAQGHLKITEDKVREAVEILQRVRELSVQGANGVYAKEDLRAMGMEVNQLLNQLVEIANARNADGTTLFSGDKTGALPFRAVMGTVSGMGESAITQVEYLGTITENRAEVSDATFIRLNYPGNRVFWAENQQLYSVVDATEYVLGEDARIFIDGVEIDLKAGDSIHAIITKINDSDAPVRARLDPMRGSLVLESTTPHQIWLQDSPDGKVLQELGLLRDGSSPPPTNLDPTVRTFGGSVFDMVIRLRDELLKGNTIDVGGRALRGIDNALNSLLATLGDIGAQGKRLEYTYTRLQTEIPDMKEIYSQTKDLDMTSAIIDLKLMENTHKAALSTAARILQPTLLDFLR
ncbi:MAG: flagellar hook-associated protein 3 [Spirochaetes bacterium]|nr:flagellar hook-associated protein 3 [Spirochaetota bacterium]